MRSKILIVCGMPRSGTSILRRVLGLHPDIGLTREARIFVNLGLSFQDHARNVIAGRHRKKLFWKRHDQGPRTLLYLSHLLSYAVLRKVIDKKAAHSALEATFPGRRWVGDKYPPYAWRIPEFVSWEDASIVYIYRDCRDVIASNIKKFTQRWAASSTAHTELARSWTENINIMRQYSERLIIVRYEQMVKEPFSVIKDLSKNLDVDVSGFNYKLFRETSIGNYKTSFRDEQEDEILAIAGPLMKELNYLDFNRISP